MDKGGVQVICFHICSFSQVIGKKKNMRINHLSSLASLRVPAKCSNSISVLTHLGQLLFPRRGTVEEEDRHNNNNNTQSSGVL